MRGRVASRGAPQPGPVRSRNFRVGGPLARNRHPGPGNPVGGCQVGVAHRSNAMQRHAPTDVPDALADPLPGQPALKLQTRCAGGSRGCPSTGWLHPRRLQLRGAQRPGSNAATSTASSLSATPSPSTTSAGAEANPGMSPRRRARPRGDKGLQFRLGQLLKILDARSLPQLMPFDWATKRLILCRVVRVLARRVWRVPPPPEGAFTARRLAGSLRFRPLTARFPTPRACQQARCDRS